MSRITDPQRAERLARAVLSDVMLYNTERVRAGIEADDLFDRLRPELDEARAFFEQRVDPEVAAKSNAFDRALVDVLVFRSGQHSLTDMVSFLVGEADADQRLDRALAAVAGIPRSRARRWIDQGLVELNDRPARPSQRVAVGDILHARPPAPIPSAAVPEAIPLDVLYEDEDVIVVDKPAGLVVHPGPSHPSGTLVNALLHHCGDLAGIGGVLRPGIVHRLDRGTSGVLVAAKHDQAHLALAEQFRDHSVERVYLALARGDAGRGFGADRAADRSPPSGPQADVGVDPCRALGPDRLDRPAALPREWRRPARGATRDRPNPPDQGTSGGDGASDRRRRGLRALQGKGVRDHSSRPPRRGAGLRPSAQR